MCTHISRLPSSTASLLSATYTIPSYESAVLLLTKSALESGASTIRLTLHIESLRFSLQDDAPPLPLSSLPPNNSTNLRSNLLHTLSSLSSIELQARNKSISYSLHLRCAKLLDLSPNQSTLTSTGSLLDVWELFCSAPVRRRTHATTPHSTILNNLRNGLLALAITYPHCSIHASTSSSILLSLTSHHHSLTLSHISHALSSPPLSPSNWPRVYSQASDGATLSGFIRRPTNTTPKSANPRIIAVDAQFASLDSWPHRVALRTLRTPLSRTVSYVLSLRTPPQAGISLVTPACERWYGTWFVDALRAALRGTSNPRSLLASPSLSPRKRPASAPSAENRFRDALICARVQKRPRTALVRMSTTRKRIPPSLSAAAATKACVRMAPGWQNPVFPVRYAGLEKQATRLGQDEIGMRNVSIAKQDIKELRIVGQVDCKFIIVADGARGLHVIDQHAASERYMYERLLKAAEGQIVSVELVPPKKVLLSLVDQCLVREREEILRRWGWDVVVPDNGDVLIIQVPKMSNLQVTLSEQQHLVTFLDSLRDGALPNAVPRPVMEAVAKAACHSAVRFGDKLTKEMCESIVWSLAECDNPFICAHGRPSIVPLVVFEQAKEE